MTKQERFGLVVGIVIVVVAAVLLLTAGTAREVVSSGVLVSAGAVLALSPWRRRSQRVRVVMLLLAVVTLVLAVVGIAVL